MAAHLRVLESQHGRLHPRLPASAGGSNSDFSTDAKVVTTSVNQGLVVF